jgi:hypothetical protein
MSLTGLFAGAMLCLGTPAGATPVTPGMSDTALTSGSLTGYTQIATTGEQTYHSCTPSAHTICGQYVEDVFQSNTNGTLDFVYQFSNGYAGDGVDALAVSSFNGWATNAYYMNSMPIGTFLGTPGHTPPASSLSVNESPDANTINFNYSSGETGLSSILIVQTGATQYVPGVIALQDSVNYNSLALGLPAFAPVPEPGFYGVVGAGLAGILSLKLRRRPNN